tara:strand:- start:428 stop:592 length:165 start_codon:yes stop_codon:yes gene_type:complete
MGDAAAMGAVQRFGALMKNIESPVYRQQPFWIAIVLECRGPSTNSMTMKGSPST